MRLLIERERVAYSDSDDDPFQFIGGYIATHDASKFFDAAKSFQWSDRIHFTGYIRHASLRYLLCLRDVAIFPSIVKEAYPLALLEAMAAGAFPIASDCGGLKDGLRQIEGVFDATTVDLTHIPMDPESRIGLSEPYAGSRLSIPTHGRRWWPTSRRIVAGSVSAQ